MDARPVLLLLLCLAIAMPVSGQEPTPGPDVVMLVHHPHPDDADILGVPFLKDCSRACDAFAARHGGQAAFRDGVDFPGFVADGQIVHEGLPPGGFDATLQLYDDAVRERLAIETPVSITIGTRVVEAEVRTSIWVGSEQDLGDGLVLWVAFVEDPVHYEPPPGLSNGVVDHPFTVRAVERIGAVEPTGEDRVDLVLPLDDDWDRARLRLAAWVEQDRGALGTFAPGEVVQAASHPVLSSGLTRQSERAVLVEAYSATWCDPCLIGDEALEELAELHGLATGRSLSDQRSYLQRPDMPPLLLAAIAAAGGVAIGFVRLGGRR